LDLEPYFNSGLPGASVMLIYVNGGLIPVRVCKAYFCICWLNSGLAFKAYFWISWLISGLAFKAYLCKWWLISGLAFKAYFRISWLPVEFGF
jgi:hypothetical protein